VAAKITYTCTCFGYTVYGIAKHQSGAYVSDVTHQDLGDAV
jgi:hypothetical protein